MKVLVGLIKLGVLSDALKTNIQSIMKKLLYLIILALNTAYSQNLPYDFEDSLIFSMNYHFNGNNYIPNPTPNYNVNYNNVYAAGQAQFDRGWNFMKNEVEKLYGLKLINKKNTDYLNSYIKSFKPKLVNELQFLDFSEAQNVNYAFRIITQYISNKWKRGEEPTSNPIIDEIKLLQKIHNEYFRFKKNDPNNFYNTNRWKDLKSLMIELQSCEISEIPYLSQKYNLY